MPLSAGCKGHDRRQAPLAVAHAAHLTGFHLRGIEYHKHRKLPIGKAVLSSLNLDRNHPRTSAVGGTSFSLRLVDAQDG